MYSEKVRPKSELEKELDLLPIAIRWAELLNCFLGLCPGCHQSINEKDDDGKCHRCNHEIKWKR